MVIPEYMLNGLNVALNEATLLGIEFDRDKESVVATFSPVAINADGQIPEDNRVAFILRPVGKFIASYRLGDWNEEGAEIVKFEPEQIFEKVQEFGKCPIYGWEFIDCEKKSNDNWKNRLSFEFISKSKVGRQHTMDLFQAGEGRHIDVKIWFDELEIYNSRQEPIDFQAFIDNGKRGWDGIYDGSSSDKFGIYPTTEFEFKSHAATHKNVAKGGDNQTNYFAKLWRVIVRRLGS